MKKSFFAFLLVLFFSSVTLLPVLETCACEAKAPPASHDCCQGKKQAKKPSEKSHDQKQEAEIKNCKCKKELHSFLRATPQKEDSFSNQIKRVWSQAILILSQPSRKNVEFSFLEIAFHSAASPKAYLKQHAFLL